MITGRSHRLHGTPIHNAWNDLQRRELPCLPVPPTPADVLEWIAAAKGRPWFPSRHAAETGTDRDALDEPLKVPRRRARRVEVGAGLGRADVLRPSDGHRPSMRPSGRAELRDPLPTAAPRRARKWAARRAGAPRPRPAAAAHRAAAPGRERPLVLRRPRDGPSAAYPVARTWSEGSHVHPARLGAVNGDDLLRGEWWRLRRRASSTSAACTCW